MNVKPFYNLIRMEIWRRRGMSPASQLENLPFTEAKKEKIQIQDDRLNGFSPCPVRCCVPAGIRNLGPGAPLRASADCPTSTETVLTGVRGRFSWEKVQGSSRNFYCTAVTC